MANFLGTTLGLFLTVVVVAFVLANYMRTPVYAPPMRGAGSAVLPCLANGRCPGGQVCAGGVCVERFMDVPSGIKDMASCSAPSCQGINQPCARGSPCAEGSFCQKDQCVKIEAPDEGEAMNQIGMLGLN